MSTLPLVAVLAMVVTAVVLRPFGPPPSGACAQDSGAVVPRIDCDAAERAGVAQSCAAAATAFRSVVVRPSGRRVRVSFKRLVNRPVRIDVFQSSRGRLVLGERLVQRYANRQSGVVFSRSRDRRGRRLGNGLFFVRVAVSDLRGRPDVRRFALSRSAGRFRSARAFQRRDSCATLTSFKLERPAFGGTRNRALGISFRVAREGRVAVLVRRVGGRVVKRFATQTRRPGVTHRLRLDPKTLGRGLYEVRLDLTGAGGSTRAALFARRL